MSVFRNSLQQQIQSVVETRYRPLRTVTQRQSTDLYLCGTPSLRSRRQLSSAPVVSSSDSPKSESQLRSPWIRQGSDMPPVQQEREASAMTKGKLLTTPSRMLKLILPLSTSDRNPDRKDVEPLALLLHPSQPLSYLERLIQSELPTFTDSKGKEKIPSVEFRAEDSKQDEEAIQQSRVGPPKKEVKSDSDDLAETKNSSPTRESSDVASPVALGDGAVESYSGAGREGPDPEDTPFPDRNFVRWSKSTEIGDFIQDAARGKEFIVEIEGKEGIGVAVPSFNDRTHYMRQRLRKSMRQIKTMVEVKEECDRIAHKSAERIAYSGAGLLIGWWYLVYRLTFETGLGWDVMEPVTYLVGLSGIIASYLFFIYKNREVSYSSAMKLTVSTRRQKLYAAKGFDLIAWENACEEANTLKREIRAIAREYDTDWDAEKDGQDEKLERVLKEENKKMEKKKQDDGDEDEGRRDAKSKKK